MPSLDGAHMFSRQKRDTNTSSALLALELLLSATRLPFGFYLLYVSCHKILSSQVSKLEKMK